MNNKLLSLLFNFIYIKGDMIKIEFDTDYGNICQNPTFYRSDLTDRVKGQLHEIIVCYTGTVHKKGVLILQINIK